MIVALYNRTKSKAQAVASDFGIQAVYDDPQKLLDEVELDAVDIITDVDTHPKFVKLAAQKGRHGHQPEADGAGYPAVR